jgi:GMP synthase-like glutamine amidotransferase
VGKPPTNESVDPQIVLAIDEVAQPNKADFGVCFGFHIVPPIE